MTEQPPPLPYPVTPVPETPGKAIAALVTGILGITMCGCFPLGIVAWVLGKQSEREILASEGRLTGAGVAKAGWITGMIGAIGGALYILGMIGVMAVAIVADSNGY
jgi:Domain of unknown function (DUF4190)